MMLKNISDQQNSPAQINKSELKAGCYKKTPLTNVLSFKIKISVQTSLKSLTMRFVRSFDQQLSAGRPTSWG